MEATLRKSLWKQFGATIDMIENAIVLCPESLWNNKLKYWYSAYHTVFYLDYYLSYDPENFMPPPPFTLSELDPKGSYPERPYAKEELLEYIEYARKKCFHFIAELTDEKAHERFVNAYRNYTRFEIALYNLRHVQHHVGQLNLLLRQNIDDAPKWVSQTNKEY